MIRAPKRTAQFSGSTEPQTASAHALQILTSLWAGLWDEGEATGRPLPPQATAVPFVEPVETAGDRRKCPAVSLETITQKTGSIWFNLVQSKVLLQQIISNHIK